MDVYLLHVYKTTNVFVVIFKPSKRLISEQLLCCGIFRTRKYCKPCMIVDDDFKKSHTVTHGLLMQC